MSCNPYLSPSVSFSDLALTQAHIANALNTFSSTLNYSPSGAYKSKDLTDGATFLTNITRMISNHATFVSKYPMLIARVKQSSITDLEYEEFLNFSGVNTDVTVYQQKYFDFISTDNYVITNLPNIITDYLNKAEIFYNDNFASSTTGNFCSTLTEVLDKFFQLQEISMNLSSQFQAISQLLQQLVDNIVDKIKGIVTDIISDAIGFVNYIQANIQRVQQFFSEENINGIKEQIKEFMASISNKFENLTPDVIKYMLFKFCQLATAIESLMMSPANSLNALLSRFNGAQGLLTNFSDQSRLHAIGAGAFLIDPETVKRIKTETGNDVNRNSGQVINNEYNATPSNWVSMPFTADERQFVSDIATLTKENINNFAASKHLDLSPLVGSGSQNIKYAPHEKIEYAWQRIHSEVYMRLVRISKRLGKRLIIISGYRSPERQLAMKAAGQTTADFGEHNKIPAWAVDVSASSFALSSGQYASFETMIKMGSQEGFNGIGIYGSFIHLDIRGSKEYWPKGNAHEQSCLKHMKNEFREGGTSKHGYDEIPLTLGDQQSTVVTPVSGPQ